MTDTHLWQLMQAQDYVCPSPATLTRFQQLWRKILRVFGREGTEKIDSNSNEELASHHSFDHSAAVSAMTHCLANWMTDAKCEAIFLLDPPFSGTAAIARDWTWQQGWALVTPPSMAQIQDVDVDGWWQQQDVHHSAWLIDDLARFFLRSSDGLRFIRVLLPRLLQGDFGQGLVVCDSWTFAFLRRIWPLNLPRVYCFAPASAELLQSLGAKGHHRQLTRVVGEARGNVGVALSLWSCQVNSEQQPLTLPAQAGDKTGFILYALLVHRGLTGKRLQEVLSTLAADELNVQLLRLAQFGIVEPDGEYWRLNVGGYLLAREFLAERDYLLDDF